MGKWFILLILFGVAASNGVEIPVWAWIVSIVATCLGSIATVVAKIKEDK